ncbi:MAG: T9SS type A sorting domain-containing protein [Muribaculaceae bacterium]|nr:T9SS type A sorting domain-containing protein [Muribaculaceae bacterium]
MKKIYALLACAAVALGTQAQNVKFFYQGHEIENGTTLVYSDQEEQGFDYVLAPAVTVVATASQQIKVVADCTTGQSIQLCIGGGCQSGTSVTSASFRANAGQSYDLEYEYFSPVEITEIVSTDITVIDDLFGSTINKITLKFDPDAAGVKVTAVSAENVTVGNGALNYSVEAPTTLALYNTAGQEVYNATVREQGSVSTASYAPGIYIYRLGSKTGKFVVK